MTHPRELLHWQYATRWQRVGLYVLVAIRPVLYVVLLGVAKVWRKSA